MTTSFMETMPSPLTSNFIRWINPDNIAADAPYTIQILTDRPLQLPSFIRIGNSNDFINDPLAVNEPVPGASNSSYASYFPVNVSSAALPVNAPDAVSALVRLYETISGSKRLTGEIAIRVLPGVP